MTDQRETITISISSLLTPISIVLVGVLIAGAIFFGLKNLDFNGEIAGTTETLPAQPTIPQVFPEQQVPQTVATSIDDDAVLGNKETATIAIVEFSDFECPFCNQFRTQTLNQIKENYIDTGKAIFVYRDLPLDFHNPAAEREAMAAECAREQGGDKVYYQYHDKIFETTPGNGEGVSVDGLVKIAGDLGLDEGQLESCLADEKYEEEMAKDASDAAKAGINGTPGFVIGKLGGDGSVEGVVVSGAQPYSVFQDTIEQQLD